jgi:prophage regulatory protein
MPPRARKEVQKPTLLDDDEGFIRKPRILQLIPIGESSWDRGVAEGRFPPPVRIATRTTAWRVRDIRQLLAKLDDQTDTVNR